MNKSGQDTYAKEMVEQFDIRPADYNLPTSSLSGGNAQKVVVAREVSLGNKLLVASQPTRGVDIGAIELIRNTLEKAEKGRRRCPAGIGRAGGDYLPFGSYRCYP